MLDTQVSGCSIEEKNDGPRKRRDFQHGVREQPDIHIHVRVMRCQRVKLSGKRPSQADHVNQNDQFSKEDDVSSKAHFGLS